MPYVILLVGIHPNPGPGPPSKSALGLQAADDPEGILPIFWNDLTWQALKHVVPIRPCP